MASAIESGRFSPVFFDFDSLDSIGSPPEAPTRRLSAAGVTINLVTKRGTNRIPGSARGLYTGGASGTMASRSGARSGRTGSGSGAPAPSNSYLGQTNICPTASPSSSQERTGTGTPSSRRSSSPANTLTLSSPSSRRSAGRGAGPQTPMRRLGQSPDRASLSGSRTRMSSHRELLRPSISRTCRSKADKALP